ncbi:hypothetical protein F5Y16DRAFT_413844 [Xylariaceae sp. FL0255]|nr:hypothetical protein F5Y16DRAFT_413844 [Xylariaceae sp. FL0255]
MLLPRDAEVNASTTDNKPLILIPAYTFLVLCPIVTATRIWSRKRSGAKLGVDDYTILSSLTFASVTDIILIIGCHYGYGMHAASLTAAERYRASRSTFYISQITYKTSINLTKASILLLYLRIFSSVHWMRYTCISLLVCIGAYCVAADLATIFQCEPIVAAFDKTIADGEKRCINNGIFWLANAGFSIITDVIILLIPMPLVYALQVPRMQKTALVLVFALGTFVVTTSILRTTTLEVQATSADPLYDVSSTMWTLIEMSVAIISACLPQIRPVIMALFPRLMPTYYNSRGEKSTSRSSNNRSDDSKRRQSALAGAGAGRWFRIETRGNEEVKVTNIIVRNGEGGKGMLEENLTAESWDIDSAVARGQIKKTVQYTVEYSKE